MISSPPAKQPALPASDQPALSATERPAQFTVSRRSSPVPVVSVDPPHVPARSLPIAHEPHPSSFDSAVLNNVPHAQHSGVDSELNPLYSEFSTPDEIALVRFTPVRPLEWAATRSERSLRNGSQRRAAAVYRIGTVQDPPCTHCSTTKSAWFEKCVVFLVPSGKSQALTPWSNGSCCDCIASRGNACSLRTDSPKQPTPTPRKRSRAKGDSRQQTPSKVPRRSNLAPPVPSSSRGASDLVRDDAIANATISAPFASYTSPVASSGAVLLHSSNDHLNAIASLRAIIARATDDLQAVRLSVSEVLERERSEAEQRGASGEASGGDPDSVAAADTEQEGVTMIEDE
ncbi:hypothetical protein PENANT_c212G03630 [Penicillium antarcticum]|uniref:Uncharacterized protein n=1 Tax=Penicillium antarcticum TaxID=416450 RepID=A0A1V6P928_9EURO|nr:hypothetical protein PENANT_c212G03630 [Penicillium antarcticum]